ncbi:MAG: DMT family transporter [Sphingomonadales bacterium]|nr:DMT family transporter [Sphingomonadales bacterium]
MPPVENTLFRTFLIAFMFAILAVVQGARMTVPRQALPSFIGQSLATLFVSIGYLASVQFIKVGLAVIIFYFFPVLIMICAPLVEGRNPGLLRILIAVIAFAGLAVAIGPDLESLDIRGILLAAAATCGAALQFFSGRSISRYMTQPCSAVWCISLSCLRFLPSRCLQVAARCRSCREAAPMPQGSDSAWRSRLSTSSRIWSTCFRCALRLLPRWRRSSISSRSSRRWWPSSCLANGRRSTNTSVVA